MDLDFTSIVTNVVSIASGATAAGVFKAPVQTLQDWWYVTYGYNWSAQAQELKIKQEANIQKLQDSMLKEVSEIHPDNIKDPSINILGPTLEASKYYIDDDEVREMFARLIASSMDKSKNNITHSAYVEIIKQMSPLDAQNLKCIFELFPNSLPTCNILLRRLEGGFNTRSTYLFISNKDISDQLLQSASINNLERLGLIKIDFGQYITDSTVYDIFKKTQEYQSAKKIVDYNNSIDNLPTFSSDPELQKGIIELTSFGINFCNTCF